MQASPFRQMAGAAKTIAVADRTGGEFDRDSGMAFVEMTGESPSSSLKKKGRPLGALVINLVRIS